MNTVVTDLYVKGTLILEGHWIGGLSPTQMLSRLKSFVFPYIEQPVLTSTSLNTLSANSDNSLQPVKLLAQRDDYTTCHIHVPEDEHRLPAIALDGNFYSFFRTLDDAAKTLSILLKLSAKGDQVVMTPTRRGYAIWVYEPTGILASPKGKTPRSIPPSFGPANCWVISDRQSGYRTCSLKVPDLPDTVPGLANGQKLFSLYRRERDADTTLKLGARLSQRGDEIVILSAEGVYAICIYEPGAIIAN